MVGLRSWITFKDRVRSWITFKDRVRSVITRKDKVRSSVIRVELGVESLLLHIERNQLKRLRLLFLMPAGCLPGVVLWECPTKNDTSRKTQVTLEGLCLLAGLGKPWSPIRLVRGGDWHQGSLDVSA